MEKARQTWQVVKQTVTANFKSSTITFATIMLVVYGFQIFFGPQNAVLGIIIAPLMLILMARDMTAHPIRHLFRQALILCVMAAAACVTALMPLPAALLIHFAVAFFLLYTYTCDCGDHLYFQYILGYLFLIFIGPISLEQLPLRLLAMVVGAACLLLYQCLKGRGRSAAATRGALLALLEDAEERIDCALRGDAPPCGSARLDGALLTFSKITENRRKAALGLSDASIAAMETVLSLERLTAALRAPGFAPTEPTLTLLRSMGSWLGDVRAFLLGKREDIPPIQEAACPGGSPDADRFYLWADHLCGAFSTMLYPENRRSFHRTSLSLGARVKIALNFSPVRAAYALRLSCLLAAGIALVQSLNLAHGKWLLFTIASVSLPYADEIGTKAKKRFFATLIGCAAGLILFPLIPSAAGKTVAMMACGYLSCYMTDYLRSFSCGTFGALGGAIFSLPAAGFAPVGGMVLVRIAYIAAGILIAVVCNCLIFPLDRERATRHLARRYTRLAQALSESDQSRRPDPQLHYHLLLRMRRLENRLRQNAKALGWDGVHSFLLSCQGGVRQTQDVSA